MKIYRAGQNLLSRKIHTSNLKIKHSNSRSLHSVPLNKGSKVLELLRPGSFVNIDNQPKDLPPFQVIQCRGGRCWVRQQTWGKYVHWEVEHRRLKSA